MKCEKKKLITKAISNAGVGGVGKTGVSSPARAVLCLAFGKPALPVRAGLKAKDTALATACAAGKISALKFRTIRI